MSDCQGRGFIWFPSSAARLPPPSPACTATSGAFYLPLANCSWEALCPASRFYIRAGRCCSSGFSPVSAFSGHAFASAVLFDCEISLGGLKSALAHSTFVIVWDLDGLLSPCPCPQTLWAPMGAGPTHFGQFLPFLLPQSPSPPQCHLQAWHGASWGPLRTHHHAPAPIRVGIYTLISSLGAGRVQPMPASPDFQAGIISREGDGGAAAGEVWGW